MIIIFFWWLITGLPLLLTILAIIFERKFKQNVEKKNHSYACVITAYKNWDITVNLVNSILAQQHNDFQVYLVADACENQNYPVYDERLTTIFPASPLHSKLKSIQAAISGFKKKHSHIIIFDPDNLVKPDFLEEIDKFHQQGFKVVQGKRTAKNLDSTVACLDAMSEFYYNHSQRKVPFVLGSSATIAGSGMSLETETYLDFIEKTLQQHGNEVIIAEDKMLQVHIVKKGLRIAYSEHALVFDEKVSTGAQASKQRTRWIASYIQFTSTSIRLFFNRLMAFDWNGILFAYIIVTPPLFLIGFLWLTLSALSLFLGAGVFWSVQTLMLVFALNLLLSLKFSGAPQKVFNVVFKAPLFVVYQLRAILRIKETKTSFLTTENTKNVSIEEVLNQKHK